MRLPKKVKRIQVINRCKASRSGVVTFLLPSTSGILFWTQQFKRELGRLELIPEEDEQIVSQLGILFDEDFLFFTFGLIVACRVFSLHRSMQDLLLSACGIQFPDQGLNLGQPSLGAQSLSHWTTREVPRSHSCLTPNLAPPFYFSIPLLSSPPLPGLDGSCWTCVAGVTSARSHKSFGNKDGKKEVSGMETRC